MAVIWIGAGRFGRLWTPAAITTALWLDAADASTVTTVSGAVSQWNDKSGNARHASQGTAGSRPSYTTAGQNGQNVLTFDGTNDWLGLTSSLFSTQTAFSWYAVATRTSEVTQCLFTERVDNNPAMVACLAVGTTSILNRAGGTSPSALIEQTENASFPTNSAQIIGSVQAPTSGSAFRNGTLVASSSDTKASLTFRRLVIAGSHGSDFNPDPIQQWWNGYIAELVVSFSTHDSTTRQRIEGYLAHKWGLTASLPADHPYKTTAPTI